MTDTTMGFWDHLTELRNRLIMSVIAVGLGAVVAFMFNEALLDILLVPFKASQGEDAGLATFRPTEAFSVVMRVSLFGGIVLASPVIIYHVWRFVSPALTKREKRFVIPASVVMAVLFTAGVLLGYWSLERGLGFLLGFGGDDLVPVIQADAYINFALRFVLVFGVAFLFPVFMFGAAATGAVSSTRLKRGRRWAVVIILVVAALLTPSGDPLTLLLLSAPLYLLYEVTILLIRLFLKK